MQVQVLGTRPVGAQQAFLQLPLQLGCVLECIRGFIISVC